MENLRFEWLFLEFKLIELLRYPFYSERAHILSIKRGRLTGKRLVNDIKMQPFHFFVYFRK